VALGTLAESAHPRTLKYLAAATLVPVLHLFVHASPMLVALDVVVLLLVAAAVAIRAARRVARGPHRVIALVVLLAMVPGPLFTLGWGLVATTVAAALIRLFHASPVTNDGECTVQFPSRDGTTIRGTYTRGEPGDPGVLLVHGLGDSRRRLVPWAGEIASHGAHVLRIDLRAHGVSDGVAVTFADREPDDVVAALDWLAAQPGVGALHVLGVSMGGGATLAAVSRPGVHVASTVELAPASSFRMLVDRRLPPFEPLHFLATQCVLGVSHGLGHRAPLELIPAADVARAGPSRILVIHSRSDTTIPAEVTEALVRGATWIEVEWIDDVSHVETPAHALEDERLKRRVLRFLDVE
jgi:pimeloyl-ACP methyl ester carboxylesterase